jgi:hypothetical protein
MSSSNSIKSIFIPLETEVNLDAWVTQHHHLLDLSTTEKIIPAKAFEVLKKFYSKLINTEYLPDLETVLKNELRTFIRDVMSVKLSECMPVDSIVYSIYESPGKFFFTIYLEDPSLENRLQDMWEDGLNLLDLHGIHGVVSQSDRNHDYLQDETKVVVYMLDPSRMRIDTRATVMWATLSKYRYKNFVWKGKVYVPRLINETV